MEFLNYIWAPKGPKLGRLPSGYPEREDSGCQHAAGLPDWGLEAKSSHDRVKWITESVLSAAIEVPELSDRVPKVQDVKNYEVRVPIHMGKAKKEHKSEESLNYNQYMLMTLQQFEKANPHWKAGDKVNPWQVLDAKGIPK